MYNAVKIKIIMEKATLILDPCIAGGVQKKMSAYGSLPLQGTDLSHLGHLLAPVFLSVN